MTKSKALHVVVRWGTSVLFARNVAGGTKALQRGLLRAHCDDLAARVAIANGELWVDEQPAPLAEGETQYVGDYRVEASAACAEPTLAPKPRLHRGALGAVALSAAVHALLVVAIVLLRARIEVADDTDALEDRAAMLVATEATNTNARDAAPPIADAESPEGGEAGGRATRTEGLMGSRTAPVRHAAYAMPGHDVARSTRGDAPELDARSFGMIGLLPSRSDEPHDAGWGALPGGTDPRFARGEMWGDDIGDAFGIGGLDVSGVGEGGGGSARGVGLMESVDGFGRGAIGWGGGRGNGGGFGNGDGRMMSGYLPGAPRNLRLAVDGVSGHLPAEVIQRIVRQNFGRFRLCYENALRDHPSLTGPVTVQFMIGRDGSVAGAWIVSTLLPKDATACVLRGFAALSFPEPEGGTVRVTYPIVFQPT